MTEEQLFSYYQQHPLYTTDSRNCPQGSIFFALKGDHFDGNQYASAALEKGCAWAVIDDPAYNTSDRCILVPDVLQAFKHLARAWRRQFHIPIIAITGTNGKTTTKELIAAVLREKYNVMATEGNYNNDIGVPKTLLRLNHTHEIAVVEMGASHPGDIRTLADTAEPTCGIITNVGKAHLQGFGSFQGVMNTKSELYDYLQQHLDNHPLVFINDNDPHLLQMAQTHCPDVPLLRYGQAETQANREEQKLASTSEAQPKIFNSQFSIFNSRLTSCSPYLHFDWKASDHDQWHSVSTHLVGTYNLDNLLAAITIGRHFGVSADAICHALEHYMPTNNRSQLVETAHNRLIVDAYNANPTSMAAALKNFASMSAAHKMAILGDMRELGDASAEEHQKATDLMQSLQLDDVWLVGEEFSKTQSPYRKFKDCTEVKAEIQRDQPQNCLILIKGSNGLKLFELPELL